VGGTPDKSACSDFIISAGGSADLYPSVAGECSASSDSADSGLAFARRRFDAARTQTITLAPREKHGIGMQSEKTLHAVLKNYIDDDEDHQEIPVDNFIADIYHDGQITEIQTARMGAMRAKLSCFLARYPVRIVYPIPAEK
jgi:hypothetical protein